MSSASLLHHATERELEALRGQKSTLVDRIRRLPRNSHKRIGLQHRAFHLTNDILQLECQIDKDRAQ